MAKKATRVVASTPVEVAAQPEAQQPVADSAPAAEASTDTDMACATCGGTPPPPTPFENFSFAARSVDTPPEGYVQMKFTGNYQAPVVYLGLYSGCISCPPVWVNPGDVARLESTGAWQKVEA